MAKYEQKRITNNITYNADVYYWKLVAPAEMVKVAEEFKASVSLLTDSACHRVEKEYTDRYDLLMAEVMLNDADCHLLQVKNNRTIYLLNN